VGHVNDATIFISQESNSELVVGKLFKSQATIFGPDPNQRTLCLTKPNTIVDMI